jgi:HPt (histidine-containing phosphotransfer) domain-containing protein
MIDWSEALAMMGGDEMLLVDVIEAFQQETPQVMADLRRAILTRDTLSSLGSHAQKLAADLGSDGER